MILFTQAYDPSEVEERSTHSQYMNRRDVAKMLLIFGLLLLGLWPVYNFLKHNTEEHVCKTNLKEIGQALNLYAQANEDLFPLAFEPSEDGSGTPRIGGSGSPVTWITAILPYAKSPSIFVCPSADESEYCYVEGPNGKPMPSTYGFYPPHSGALRSSSINTGRSVVVAETSNMGARDTFDPLKIDGLKQDGFLIGFDNGQFEPNGATKFLTRLAYPGTASGNFEADGSSRHGGGNHMLTVEGSLIQGGPDSAVYVTGGGYWTAPVRATGRSGLPGH